MNHDPFCPSLNCIDRTCEECCRCELIGKVRKDERERAGIRQTEPSWKYPFTTAVTVRQP